MMVKELLKALEGYPEESRVVVQGYEDGFDDISTLQSIQVENHPDPKWYCGKYIHSQGEGESVVLLFGRSRMDT